MPRIGRCMCGGELSLSVVMINNNPTAFCKKCLKEYPVEMVGKSRCYTLVKEIITGLSSKVCPRCKGEKAIGAKRCSGCANGNRYGRLASRKVKPMELEIRCPQV